MRRDIRSFAVDAISEAILRDEAAKEVSRSALAEVMDSGYGIFSGRDVTWARLRFSPDRARWVAAETWHPQQIGSFDASGHWVLELPYNDSRELLMDILKHGSAVEVISPDSLRQQVISELDAALKSYRAGREPDHAT